MQVLAARLGTLNSGKARAQSIRTFSDFVNEDWSPVILPTLKYATQKHYQYMLDAHLIPAFGNSQLRALTREELQGFLTACGETLKPASWAARWTGPFRVRVVNNGYTASNYILATN